MVRCNGVRFVFMGILAAFAAVPTADAAPRRFFARRSANYDSGGLKDIAPKADPASTDFRALQASYSYEKAMENEHALPDRLRVFLLVRDPEVLEATEGVTAEVKITDLSRERATRLRYFPVSFQPTSTPEYQLATFEVANAEGEGPIVEPARIYRLFVNLHRRSGRYGKETVLGKVVSPYYVASSGNNRLDRARCHIAMRTFREFYYAQRGWRSNENYPMDCYAYYTWATGSCTVGAQNGRAILDRLFGGRRPYNSGGQILRLAKQGPIHGDYVRKPGHSFMLLSYDEQAGHVWTMEGNFNSTIEVVIRSVDSGWVVGHLVDEHIRPGLFEMTGSPAVDAARPSL
ncbi:MAG: hypothetical protein FJ297_15850 [Planctomycetes bacterium]|nr:hypothetical protein [Planctomycetota bacterium]